MSIREDLEEILAEENPSALFADGFDDAIIGLCRRFSLPPLVAYDYEKCIDILVAGGMDCAGAIEYFEFNTIGGWFGEGTPVFIEKAGT